MCRKESARSSLWIKLSLKAMLWLVWSSIQNTKTFFRSVIRLFHFLIIHVFIGVHFRHELFLCIYNLADCRRRPGLGSVLALDMLSSLSLIISSFWFKMRDMWLFLSLKHIRGYCSVVNWPQFKVHMSRGTERPDVRKRDRQTSVSWAVRTHNTDQLSLLLTRVWPLEFPNNCNGDIKDHWSAKQKQ